MNCARCKQDKRESEFYPSQHSWCAQCVNARQKQRRATAEGKLADRRWKTSEKGRAAEARYRQKPEARELKRQLNREWNARNPEQRKQHYSVYNHSDKNRAAQKRHSGKKAHLRWLAKALRLITLEALD